MDTKGNIKHLSQEGMDIVGPGDTIRINDVVTGVVVLAEQVHTHLGELPGGMVLCALKGSQGYYEYGVWWRAADGSGTLDSGDYHSLTATGLELAARRYDERAARYSYHDDSVTEVYDAV